MIVFDIEFEMGSMDLLINFLFDFVIKVLLFVGFKRVGGVVSVLMKSIMVVVVFVIGSINYVLVDFWINIVGGLGKKFIVWYFVVYFFWFCWYYIWKC